MVRWGADMAPKSLLASDVSSRLRFPDPFGVAWITMSTCTLSQTEVVLETDVLPIFKHRECGLLTRQGGRVKLRHPSQTFAGSVRKLDES